ncbi:guanylate kinase [Enterococcus sp. CWB-B31]|uniref:guanylate kinase n=1 Tax=Enterococcus sp. CWB-B31 TaxID=2885159 RepID=UPI001E3B1614|nr:guanylate kinase [Enterococcus sp. CWB-B31]MCB5954060.1 guanylate kinase [Enterococcus sp. CWB-B31]
MKITALNNPLFVIMGPSGSGKTKITELAFPKGSKLVSFTTRQKRRMEQEGVDYYFVSKDQFERLIGDDQLVEHDTYAGNLYGIGEAEIIEKTKEQFAYNVLTLKGFQIAEQRFGDKVIPIFLNVSKENIMKRLKKRNEDAQTIKNRAAIYEKDMRIKEVLESYPNFHEIDGNQGINKVVAEMKKIIQSVIEESVGQK